MLIMDRDGRFARTSGDEGRRPVTGRDLRGFFEEKIEPLRKCSDVFVWVHGWRTDHEAAQKCAGRLFGSIDEFWSRRRDRYPELSGFDPRFVAVHWDSSGRYRAARDRAAAMTEVGHAGHFLAALLGYLKPAMPEAREGPSGVLRSRHGYYVHCLGHSFGGRFLAAAIADAGLGAAAQEFTVDSFLTFQMAAPNQRFGGRLRAILEGQTLRGPIVLTHSRFDRANLWWHFFAEWQAGIGATGAIEPADRIRDVGLLEVDIPYMRGDQTILSGGNIINVDANRHFRGAGCRWVEGAHSDFWCEESLHLILSLAAAAR